MKNELEPPIFSLTTFPPRRLSSKHLPPSVGMVSKFFCWYQKHWDDVHRVILLANSCISSFSSVLVRNSAISSADWSEHCWLFSCSLTHRLVTVKYMVLWWLFLFKTCVNSDQVSPQTWSKIQKASVYTGNRLRPWLILRRHLTISERALVQTKKLNGVFGVVSVTHRSEAECWWLTQVALKVYNRSYACKCFPNVPLFVRKMPWGQRNK